jgi:hypothetical protein
MSDDAIFVAIAAYREPELADTISSCLQRANRPERLRFGVCQQYDDDLDGAGADSLDELAAQWPIERVRLPHHQTRGGCWARNVAQGLYQGEPYTMQIDAHSRLAPGWDDEFCTVMADLPSERPILTGFPPLYVVEDGIDRIVDDSGLPVPITVIDHWSRDGWLHHPTTPAPQRAALRPRRTRMLSGAFVFTIGRWNIDVRQDPEHLYAGEEFALTVRSFTHGYELWNPPRRLVWHRLHPQSNAKYITDDPDERSAWRHARACARLRTLLDGDPEGILGPYGLGDERPLDDFWRFSGLHWPIRTIDDDARRGVEPTGR